LVEFEVTFEQDYFLLQNVYFDVLFFNMLFAFEFGHLSDFQQVLQGLDCLRLLLYRLVERVVWCTCGQGRWSKLKEVYYLLESTIFEVDIFYEENGRTLHNRVFNLFEGVFHIVEFCFQLVGLFTLCVDEEELV